jgi:hypothetical protein
MIIDKRLLWSELNIQKRGFGVKGILSQLPPLKGGEGQHLLSFQRTEVLQLFGLQKGLNVARQLKAEPSSMLHRFRAKRHKSPFQDYEPQGSSERVQNPSPLIIGVRIGQAVFASEIHFREKTPGKGHRNDKPWKPTI